MSSIVRKELTRVFEVDGMLLPDPLPHATTERAVQVLAQAGRPHLLNCEVRGPTTRGDHLVYTLHRAVGTKGAMAMIRGARDRGVAKQAVLQGRLTAIRQSPFGSTEPLDPDMCRAMKSLSENAGEQPLHLPGDAVPWML